MQHVSGNAVGMAEQIMHEAAVGLVTLTKEENLEQFIETPFGKIARVAVTSDGTWERRGHSSKTVVIFLLFVTCNSARMI